MPIFLPLSFTSLEGCTVSECVVSGSYIALLLEDGRVCRIRYSEEHPPMPSNTTSSNSSKEKRWVLVSVASLVVACDDGMVCLSCSPFMQ